MGTLCWQMDLVRRAPETAELPSARTAGTLPAPWSVCPMPCSSRRSRPCSLPSSRQSACSDGNHVLGAAVADVRACAASVGEAGIRVAGFNSDELATDVADLVRLLGYDKVVLNGVSYGTLWASAVLRDHPERVESAILDSLVQQSQPAIASQMLGFQTALQGADEACAKEPTLCGPVGLGLLARTEALVQDLEARPVAWSAGPGGRFTSGAAVSILTTLLAFAPLSELPAFVDFAELLVEGGLVLDVVPPSLTRSLLEVATLARPGDSLAHYLSITCADNAAAKQAEMQAQLSKVRPALQALAQAQLQEAYDTFAAWPARQDLPASSSAPVRSSIPVLILSGATDPLTPPAWAEEAARTLNGATLVRLPLRGHSLQSGSVRCAPLRDAGVARSASAWPSAWRWRWLRRGGVWGFGGVRGRVLTLQTPPSRGLSRHP